MDGYDYGPGKGKYNQSIDCTEKTNCKKCGWNPEVEKIRKKKAREKA